MDKNAKRFKPATKKQPKIQNLIKQNLKKNKNKTLN